MKTLDDIIRKVCKYSENEVLNTSDDITIGEAIECMEEYHQERMREELTDEMINEHFTTKSETTALTLKHVEAMENRRIGAKWARDKTYSPVPVTDEECKCLNNNDIYMTTLILCRKCNKEVKTIRIR